MKKCFALRTLTVLLVFLMALSAFVGCNKDAATPTEPFPETTPEVTTVTTRTPQRPVGVYGAHTIRAINGTLSNGKSVGYYDKGESIYFIANTPPGGYQFSHWENAEGEVISTSRRVDTKVVGAETYKACYEMYFVPRGDDFDPSDYKTGKPVAAYWYPELDDTVEKVEAIRENANSYLSEFFYITDTHWLDNAQYSPALINYLAKELNNPHVTFGGDVIVRYNSNKTKAIDQEINGFFYALSNMVEGTEWLKIFSVLGNHDRNGSSNQPSKSERLTEKEAYQYYLARQEEWGVVTENNPNHGYYDDAANKVRYIQFYLSDSKYGMIEDGYVADALAWVEEQVMALDEGWTVVLFTHGYYGGGHTVTDINLGIKERVLALKANAKADIACWITGHIHQDSTEMLVSEDGQTSIRMITHNADAKGYGQGVEKGSKNEQSFSYFQIDPVNKMIYMTRVGAGEDAVYSYGDPIEDDGLGGNPANKIAS